MIEDRKGINASIFIDKEVVLFLDDGDRVQRRDGFLKGFDHTHYYILMTKGSRKGEVVSYLRTDVKRLEPLYYNELNRGDKNYR